METSGESKFSYLLIGLGLGAIGGLMFALRIRVGSARDELHRR